MKILLKKIKYSIKYCENISVTLRMQLLHMFNRTLHRNSFGKVVRYLREIVVRSCQCKINRYVGVSYTRREISRIVSIARSMLVPYIFILNANRRLSWKSTCGLNIDINACQRRSEMSLNRNLESLRAYQRKYRKIHSNRRSLNDYALLRKNFLQKSFKRLPKNWLVSLLFLRNVVDDNRFSTLYEDWTRFIWFYYPLVYTCISWRAFRGSRGSIRRKWSVRRLVYPFSRATCKIPGCSGGE